jgi:hypothetical protein
MKKPASKEERKKPQEKDCRLCGKLEVNAGFRRLVYFCEKAPRGRGGYDECARAGVQNGYPSVPGCAHFAKGVHNSHAILIRHREAYRESLPERNKENDNDHQ